MDQPIGLIVKGGPALFLQGPDPGAVVALSIVNRYRMGDFDAVPEHGLVIFPRPQDLSGPAWKYGFFSIGASMPLRLEPGPFDSALQDVVKAMDEFARSTPEAQGE